MKNVKKGETGMKQDSEFNAKEFISDLTGGNIWEGQLADGEASAEEIMDELLALAELENGIEPGPEEWEQVWAEISRIELRGSQKRSRL